MNLESQYHKVWNCDCILKHKIITVELMGIHASVHAFRLQSQLSTTTIDLDQTNK